MLPIVSYQERRPSTNFNCNGNKKYRTVSSEELPTLKKAMRRGTLKLLINGSYVHESEIGIYHFDFLKIHLDMGNTNFRYNSFILTDAGKALLETVYHFCKICINTSNSVISVDTSKMKCFMKQCVSEHLVNSFKPIFRMRIHNFVKSQASIGYKHFET